MSNIRDIVQKLDARAESWWTTGEGVNRTPLLPTRRDGRPSLLFIQFAIPNRQPRGSRPDTWGTVDFRSGRLLTYSAMGAPEHFVELRTIQAPSALGDTSIPALRRALVVDYPNWVQAFFGQTEERPQHREQVLAALLSAIPLGLTDWTLSYCHDFWSWLSDLTTEVGPG